MIESISSFVVSILLVEVETGGIDVKIDLGTGLAGGAVGAFLTTLIVGAILIAIAPRYTERMMEYTVSNVLGSFVYGVVVLVLLIVLTFLLVITIFGILIAIPLILAAILIWSVGAAIAYLAIADRLVGHEDGWLKPLVIGAAINGGLALTGVGGILTFAIGATGFGAVLQNV